MTTKFVNNYQTTLAANISASATSILLQTSTGAALGTLTSPDVIYATIYDPTDITVKEIIKITAISGDTLTVVRAQDSTAAQIWASGSTLEVRIPRVVLNQFEQKISSYVKVDDYGAIGDGTTDDSAAIQAAIASLTNGGKVLFSAKEYYIGSTITITNHSISLEGVALGNSPIDYGGAVHNGTRLKGKNGTAGITVTSVGYFQMKDINLSLPAGATSACIGVKVDSCFLPKIVDCRITNYSTGIKLLATTDSYIERCYLSSTSSTINPVIGLDIDGTTDQNPSVVVSHCIAAHASFSGDAYGYYIHGDRINDIFLDSCEAAGCSYGYRVNGVSLDAGYSADIHMRGCVSDAFTVAGFNIDGMNVDSIVEIVNGWSAGSGIGIYIGNSSSRVRVSGMQVFGGTNGIYLSGGSGHIVTDNYLLYQGTNGIVVDAATQVTVANNHGHQKTAAACPFISLVSNAAYIALTGNSAFSTTNNGWSYGIISTSGCNNLNIASNSFPATLVTTPYSVVAVNQSTTGVGYGGSAFLAYMNANQVIGTAAFTKLVLDTEVFDVKADYDATTNYRFQPLMAGYYQINMSILSVAAAGAGGVFIGSIYKNGAEYIRCFEVLDTNLTGLSNSGSALIYMNGSSDYIEFYVFQSTGLNQTMAGGGTAATCCSGAFVRGV